MKKPEGPENVIAMLIVGLLLCIGSAALAFSWVSLASLKSWLSSAAFDGKADFLTSVRYQKLVVGTRFLAAALMVMAAVTWFLRRRLADLIKALLTGLGEIVHDLLAAIREDRNREGVWHLAILALVVCAALALRLLFIGLPLRYDEATTYMEYASKPFPVVLSYYSSPNNHIFHSLLVHLSTWLFGNGIWAIRLPALMAGWLIVPASYMAFRLLYDKRVGLMTAALCAVCPVLIEFSTNARGYTLVTLLFIITLSLMARLRTKPNSAGWVLVGLLSALGLWTIPVMAFPIAVACVWWLLSPLTGESHFSWLRLRPLLFSMAMAAFLTILLYAPVMLGSGWEMLWSASGSANRESIQHLIVNSFIGPWGLTTRHWPASLTIALGGLLLAGMIAHWVILHSGAWVGFALITGSGLVLLIFRSNPFERIWLFATPVILGICAAGLTWLLDKLGNLIGLKNNILVATTVMVVALGLYTAMSPGIRSSEEGSTLRDASQITERIAQRWQKGDSVLTACPVDEPLAYHFKRQGLPVSPVFDLITGKLDNADRLWVVSKHPHGPSLAELLRLAGSQIKDFTPPSLIEQYPQASLYMMKKRP